MFRETTAVSVARGAALLDQYRPGWADEIDLDELRLESGSDCVLGQLYGDYGEGRAQLRILDTAYSQDLGFTAGLDGPAADWFGLNRCWRALIEDRRVDPRQLQFEALVG
jgi:hypothetical protein